MSSFGIGNNIFPILKDAAFNNFCWTCYDSFDNQGNCTRTCSRNPACVLTIIHIATGTLSIVPTNPPSNTGDRTAFGAMGYNGSCYELDANNHIQIACKYSITIPVSNHPLPSPDSVVLKVFEDEIALNDADITRNFYASRSTNNPTPFIVNSSDYELVCINDTAYYQANLFMNFSFEMKRSSISSFLKNYEVVLDLVPFNNGPHPTGTGSTHTHTTTYPSQCQNVVKGSYNYYRCLDKNENNPNGHQGKHIVRLEIDQKLICGYWNYNVPQVIEATNNN